MRQQVPNPNQVKTHGIQKTVSFGIKNEGLAHIFNVLRNQLYSDKILAVIREYSCNAVDAHVEAGKPNRPIEITLPTMMSPVFKIRDFGPALSDGEIEDVYAFYGESTKRNSNAQIGQLGLGSKSAFAYGDNFVINSYLDGTKHSHNAFIDSSQIGQIAKLSEESTDEENGVEIVIGVKESDCSEFEDKAADLFRYFKIKPIVKGATNASKFDFKESSVLFRGKNWEYFDSSTTAGQSYGYNRPSGSPMAIMGNIGYPIDTYSLGKFDNDEREDILNENLILHFEIGDLEISASREKLQYTEYTQKSIKARIKEVSDEILETVEKRFKDCETMFAAKCFFGSVFDYSSGLYSLRNLLGSKIKWNGKSVDSDDYSTYSHSGVNLLHYKKHYGRKRVRGEETNRLDCKENTVVVENDMGNRRQALNRIVPLVEGEGKRVYLFEWENAASKKKFIKDEGFDATLVKLSSLPKEPLTKYYGSNASAGTGFKNEKHSAKCFEYDFGFDGSRWHTKKSDYWKIADLDVENESGVYVIIDKFHPENTTGSFDSWDDPNRINRLKQELAEIGIEFPKHVYAFKVKERAKIEGKDGWTNLFSWAKEQLKKEIKDSNLDQAWIDTQKRNDLNTQKANNDSSYRNREYSSMLNHFVKDIIGKVAVTDGAFADFVYKYMEMGHTEKIRAKIKTIRSISTDFGVKFNSPTNVKPTYDLKPLLKEVMEKYSMFSMVDWGSWDWDKDKTENVVNYIDVIDVCNKAK